MTLDNLNPNTAFGISLDVQTNNSICCVKEMTDNRTYQCLTGLKQSCSTNVQNLLAVQSSNTFLFSQLPRLSSDGSMIFFVLQPESAGKSTIIIGNSSSPLFTVASFSLSVSRPAMTPNFLLNNVAACLDWSLPCNCPLPGSPATPTPAVVLSCEHGCPLQTQAALGIFVPNDNATYLRLQDDATARVVLFFNGSDSRWSVPCKGER